MDVFTDMDIFRDLQDISRRQGVAVYILLDQALLPQFLEMCMDLKVHPEQEKVCALLFLVWPDPARERGCVSPLTCQGIETWAWWSASGKASQDSDLGLSRTMLCRSQNWAVWPIDAAGLCWAARQCVGITCCNHITSTCSDLGTATLALPGHLINVSP